MLSRSSWTEPSKPVDSFLLDPDVAACPDNKLLDPKFPCSSPADSDGKQLDLGSPGKDFFDKRRFLESKSCNHNFGMVLGMEKGFGFSRVSSISQNFMLHGWINKGKRAVDFYCQRKSDNIFGTFGKGSIFEPKTSLLHFSSLLKPLVEKSVYEQHKAMDSSAILEECGSDSSVQKALEMSPSTDIGLPPAPFESISSIVILDVFEDRLSEEDEDTSTVLCHFEPEPLKKAEAPSISKLVFSSPIRVRRSPRFLGN